MNLIKSENPWDCGAASLAILLSKSLSQVRNIIGHDGSEILWPEEKDPFNRKGFQEQELVDAALRTGVALIKIDGNPAIVPFNKPDSVRFVYANYEERFSYYLENYSGLLCSETPNHNGHWSVWNHSEGTIYDPDTGRHTFEEYPLAIISLYVAVPSDEKRGYSQEKNDGNSES